jgi:SAM-dependent methyltransferase
MRQRLLEPPGARETYERMAPFYDDLTAHHDYELYLRNVLPAAERLGLGGRRLLDVGCGTGKSFLPLVGLGWQITGCDISPSMLAVAQAKTRGRVRLETADARALPTFGAFDLAWSLGDALNYLRSPAELTAALAGMRRNLAPRGLVAFDLNTELTYRSFYAERRVDECRGRSIVWQGMVDGSWAGGSFARGAMSVEDESGRAFESFEHRQRHFRPYEVSRCVHEAGLSLRVVCGLGFDAVLQRPLDELRHTKALYLASVNRAKAEGR